MSCCIVHHDQVTRHLPPVVSALHALQLGVGAARTCSHPCPWVMWTGIHWRQGCCHCQRWVMGRHQGEQQP
jgi:hypothetical protein